MGEYGCNFCDKIYTSKQNLEKHIQSTHPNPSRVEDANVGFLVFDSPLPPLKVRQKKRIFKCKQCNYESGRKLNLKRHIETHTENRVKTGRPKKPPGELSAVTQRLYAKKSQNAFMEEMKARNLEAAIKKLMRKDFRQKDPHVSKVTEKEVINMIADFLPQNLHTFVDALEQIKDIYRMAHATTVEIDHREKIELFRNTWLTLMQDHGQTMPLKVHIILDHLSDYFELESKTLRNTNDQFIEACHSKVRKFFDNHPNFNHKDKSTDMYGDAILTAITHFNSYNLGSVQ